MKFIIVLSFFILSQCALSFAAQDSAAATDKEAVQKGQENPVKESTVQTMEEEDILFDEAEAKKTAQSAVDTAGEKQLSAPSIIDSLPTAKKTLEASADSQKTAPPLGEQKADSAAASAAADTAVAPAEKKSETVRAPATVESIRSINFAKNLKDYRSPKLAMFLSLLVPGLGQAYVKRYYKTAIFVALEATVIGFSVAFSNKGKQKNIEAKEFADENYDYQTMKDYYDKLRVFFLSDMQSENDPDSAAQARIFDIYMDDSLSSFTQAYANRSEEFYRTIEANSFVQGWKDCQPKPDFTLNVNSDSIIYAGGYKYRKNDSLKYKVIRIDTAKGKNVVDSTLIFGYSPKQNEFSQMVSKSNSYYKTAQNILFSMVINHIVSAVDALISAKAYNDELIGKESVWRHISIEQLMVNAGSSSIPGCALKVRF